MHALQHLVWSSFRETVDLERLFSYRQPSEISSHSICRHLLNSRQSSQSIAIHLRNFFCRRNNETIRLFPSPIFDGRQYTPTLPSPSLHLPIPFEVFNTNIALIATLIKSILKTAPIKEANTSKKRTKKEKNDELNHN